MNNCDWIFIFTKGVHRDTFDFSLSKTMLVSGHKRTCGGKFKFVPSEAEY